MKNDTIKEKGNAKASPNNSGKNQKKDKKTAAQSKKSRPQMDLGTIIKNAKESIKDFKFLIK